MKIGMVHGPASIRTIASTNSRNADSCRSRNRSLACTIQTSRFDSNARGVPHNCVPSTLLYRMDRRGQELQERGNIRHGVKSVLGHTLSEPPPSPRLIRRNCCVRCRHWILRPTFPRVRVRATSARGHGEWMTQCRGDEWCCLVGRANYQRVPPRAPSRGRFCA